MKNNPLLSSPVRLTLFGLALGLYVTAIAFSLATEGERSAVPLLVGFAGAILLGIVLFLDSIARTRERARAREQNADEGEAVSPRWFMVHPNRDDIGRLADILGPDLQKGGTNDSFWGETARGDVPFVVLVGYLQKTGSERPEAFVCRPFGQPDGPRRLVPTDRLAVSFLARRRTTRELR